MENHCVLTVSPLEGGDVVHGMRLTALILKHNDISNTSFAPCAMIGAARISSLMRTSGERCTVAVITTQRLLASRRIAEGWRRSSKVPETDSYSAVTSRCGPLLD